MKFAATLLLTEPMHMIPINMNLGEVSQAQKLESLFALAIHKDSSLI